MGGRQRPRAKPTERQACQIDALFINLVLLPNFAEDRQRILGAGAARAPVCARFALRKYRDERECLGTARILTNGFSKANFGRSLAVRPTLAGSVKKQDCREGC